MKFITRFLCVPVAGLLALTSCAKDEDESYVQFENQALEAWMTQHRPDLVKNYQPDGGYYIDVLDAGEPDKDPLNKEPIWVSFDFTGRDLAGNIILTRSASDAKLTGAFSKYTHYVPFYRYCGTENTGLMEGTWLAMRNTLKLDQEYFDKYKNDPERRLTSTELQLRIGSKIQLYMPSTVVGNGVEGTGGYEGQGSPSKYTLSANRPFIVTMEIRDTVSNPLEREGKNVDEFSDGNGGRLVYGKEADEKTQTVVRPTDPEDPNHAYVTDKRWVSACDTIPQLYVNVRYDPTQAADRLDYPAPYHSGYEPYVTEESVKTIDEKIAEALKKRFYPDDDDKYEGVVKLDADSVTLEGTAKIWYIGRFLDGFIFDTNIDEVKKIIYGEVKSAGSALSYKPSERKMIEAFHYTIPNLKYGQWAELSTTSTNAYGSSGKTGSTSSSTSGTSGYSSSYYDYLNYLNYANSYYGSGGYYGGYYNNYYGGYGGYYGGYYGDMYGSDYNSSSTGTTVKTINTEIPSFTPLIFQLYIEPKE